jgi:hypothetical protein
MSGAAFAQSAYPAHPAKIIAPFAAGGPSDIIASILADKLSASLKQQFYVEDYAGAGGNIGMTQVARSAPGRLHHPGGELELCGQSEPLCHSALRSLHGFCPGYAGSGFAEWFIRAPFSFG